MTYSIDFRKKVLSVREKEGLSIRQTAKRFGVASRSIVDWLKRLEPMKHRKRRSSTIDLDALKQDVENFPDAYKYERAERIGGSASGIGHALKRLGVTFKKKFPSSQSGSRKAIYILPKD